MIHEVKSAYVCAHNAVMTVISFPPVWPVRAEMKHMPQREAIQHTYKLEWVCGHQLTLTIHVVQSLMEGRWASGEWMAITPLRL